MIKQSILAVATIFISPAAGARMVADVSTGVYSQPASDRVEALQRVEADRDAVLIELAGSVAAGDRAAYVMELDGLENHELIDLLVAENPPAGAAVAPMESYSDMVFTALPSPCRILDTRDYQDVSRPIESGFAREVYDLNIADQGGDATCSGSLSQGSALVLGLTAVSPGFPGKFTAKGFGTLFNGSAMASGWKTAPSLPTGHRQYTYNTPPYNKTATVVWDEDTKLITTMAIVARNSAAPKVVLYSSGQAHYTIDVMGYLDSTTLCPASTTYINGLCWSAEKPVTDWYGAIDQCQAAGGSLPSAAAISGAVVGGKIPDKILWADGYYYYDGKFYKQMASSTAYHGLVDNAFRCVFTPSIPLD